MLKKIIKLLFLLALAGLVFYFIMGSGGEKPGAGGMGGGSTKVEVYTVPEREVLEMSEFSGRLEAVDYVEVKPKVSGTIEKVYFQDGQEVKKGQKLFTIDPGPYAAQASGAKGAVEAARAEYENARESFARAEKLFEAKAISKQEFDSREAALNSTKGRLENAQGNYQFASINYGYSTVTAPISGKISRAEVRVGNYVSAGAGSPTLANIVAASPIYASFEMDEGSFLSYIQGRKSDALKEIPVSLSLANNPDVWVAGKVHSFDNQLNPATASLRVRAIFDNKDGTLIPGLFVKVKIGSAEKINHVLISERSIGTDQRKKFVLVVGADNKTEYREITTGANVDGLRIVKSGLKAGEKVVYTGLSKLRPGMPIEAQVIDIKEVK